MSHMWNMRMDSNSLVTGTSRTGGSLDSRFKEICVASVVVVFPGLCKPSDKTGVRETHGQYEGQCTSCGGGSGGSPGDNTTQGEAIGQ